MDLQGKTALITGSTGGIGSATARLFARNGATVIVTGRDRARGQAVVDDIGGDARLLVADLSDPEAIRGLAADAGNVDVLVNNAALFPLGATVDEDVAGFDETFAANVRAPFLLTAALAPGMVARGGGAIVNISTMAAQIGMPGLAVYSATKAALEALTRTWAAEFADGGVRVNTVAPGPTRTDMVAAMMGDAAEEMGQTTLLRRLASPEEIAEAILFLASDRSSYLTGATVAADAGRTAI